MKDLNLWSFPNCSKWLTSRPVFSIQSSSPHVLQPKFYCKIISSVTTVLTVAVTTSFSLIIHPAVTITISNAQRLYCFMMSTVCQQVFLFALTFQAFKSYFTRFLIHGAVCHSRLINRMCSWKTNVRPSGIIKVARNPQSCKTYESDIQRVSEKCH